VLRGSSWQEGAPGKIKLSYRTHHMSTSRANEIGFRVVLGDNTVETASQAR
jgi:formylglycine-generating enzyme required for sulfatase activity